MKSLAGSMAVLFLLGAAAVPRAAAQDESERFAPDHCPWHHCGGCWYEPGRWVDRVRYEQQTVWVERRVLVGWEWREVRVPGGGREQYDPATDTYVVVGGETIRRERVPVYRVERVPETRLVPIRERVWTAGRWHHCGGRHPPFEYPPHPWHGER